MTRKSHTPKTSPHTIIAGPLGFYPLAHGTVLGRRCDSIEEAYDLIDTVDDMMERGGFTAATHAWRMMN
jgi:hypothetical protein